MKEDPKERTVLEHVEHLVAEEHELYNQGARDETSQRRLRQLEVELDQCWDLLRQRRALREAGRNPDEAHVRPPGVVENYEG
jgi:hypothetical protein